MTEIVTIMPRRSLCHRVMPLLTASAAAIAILTGCSAFVPGFADLGENISHDQARAFVAEAGGDTTVREIEYPDIRTAAKVVLVGRDCGPDGKVLLLRESADVSLDEIMNTCREIEAHSTEAAS